MPFFRALNNSDCGGKIADYQLSATRERFGSADFDLCWSECARRGSLRLLASLFSGG